MNEPTITEKILCFLGLHEWKQAVAKIIKGKQELVDICVHCGKARRTHGL